MYRFEFAKTLGIVEKRPHLRGPWMVNPHGSVHVLHPIGFAGPEDLIQIADAQRRRFLDQQVLLLLGRQDAVFAVEGGRERAVNGVNLRIVEDVVVGSVRLGGGLEAGFLGEGGGLFDGSAADGDYGGVVGEVNGLRDLAGYVGAAQDSEADRWSRRGGRGLDGGRRSRRRRNGRHVVCGEVLGEEVCLF